VRSAAATSGGTHVSGQLVERVARRQRQYGVQNDGDPEILGPAIKMRRMRYRRDTGAPPSGLRLEIPAREVPRIVVPSRELGDELVLQASDAGTGDDRNHDLIADR
jgi:hypothetical protein